MCRRSEGFRSSLRQGPGRFASDALVALFGISCIASGSVHAAGDAAAGEALFTQCAGCHVLGPDAAHRFGPQLNGVLERGAGAAEGYDYSQALVGAVAGGLAWDEGTLDGYLDAPMEVMPGTKMAYPGLKSADDRGHVIAYLASFAPDGSRLGLETAEATATDQAAVTGNALTEEPRPLARDVPVPEHGVLHLGRPALEEEVLAWDIDIRPDGTGLPVGSGTVEAGGELYDAQCASCHGVFGEGEGRWPVLAGGHDSLTDDRPEKTIGSYWPYLSTVYDYVRRAMPFGNARSLSDDDVYALTAYLLYLNDVVVDESFELSSANFGEMANLPNEANFKPDDRFDEPAYAPLEEPCMSDCATAPAEVVQRARVLDVTPDGEGDEGGAGVD